MPGRGGIWRRLDRLDGGGSCEHKEAQKELLRAIDEWQDIDEPVSPHPADEGVVCGECGKVVEKLTVGFLDSVMDEGGGGLT